MIVGFCGMIAVGGGKTGTMLPFANIKVPGPRGGKAVLVLGVKVDLIVAVTKGADKRVEFVTTEKTIHAYLIRQKTYAYLLCFS